MQDTPDVETPRPDTLSPDAVAAVIGAPAPDAVAAEPAIERRVNSVDATVGQPMVDRVMDRKNELEALLLALPESDVATRDHIGLALSTIQELLSGDLANVPAVVMVDMNRWLERNKHLGERSAPAEATPVEPAPVEPA